MVERAGSSCSAPFGQVIALLQVAKANYGRLESKYYQVEFGMLSVRKALNMTFEFLWENVGHNEQAWNRDWADIFDAEDDRSVQDDSELPAGTVVNIARAAAI